MSTMQEQQRAGPVLAPGRVRRSFPREFKADAVAQVLDSVAVQVDGAARPAPLINGDLRHAGAGHQAGTRGQRRWPVGERRSGLS